MMGLLLAEYGYWKGVAAPEGMGAIANVVAAVAMRTSVDDFKKQIANR